MIGAIKETIRRGFKRRRINDGQNDLSNGMDNYKVCFYIYLLSNMTFISEGKQFQWRY